MKRRSAAPEAAAGVSVGPGHLAKPTAGRFVVISDLHAHPWAAFAHGDGLDNDRLQRTLAVLRASLLRAQELECPWVFGGDLVHTAGYALNVVLGALVDVLWCFPSVPKLVVWGNHDARGVGGRIVLEQTVWAAPSRAVANLTVLDPSLSPPIVECGGLTFSGAGAQPRIELLRPPLQSDVGVYHGIVRGSTGPNGHVFPDGIDGEALMARHKIAIVGDLHHPQHWGRPDGLPGGILVPGSPEHHNFGDAGGHGWWVCSESSVEMVPSGSPEFRTVETARDVHADGHFYRVLTAAPGVQLPENATAVASAPTVVENRTTFRGLTGEQILAAWIQIEPGPNVPTDQALLELGRQLLSLNDVGQLRNVRLRRLGLRNFCSYAEADFEIHDGTWLVLGKGRDYPSNGAGKSTLFEAIFWLLFGRTTKGLTGDEVIRWGAPECCVWGEFVDADGTMLTATRRRGEASTLEVVDGAPPFEKRWEAASVNEMTAHFTRRLGVTPELFQALGYFSQERVLLFASATDGERKEMLADLIGLSAYQTASTIAQQHVEELQLSLAVNGGLQRGTQERLDADRTALAETQALALAYDENLVQCRRAAEANVEAFEQQIEAAREQLMGAAVEQLERDRVTNEAALQRDLRDWEAQITAVVTEDQARASRAAADEARLAMVRFVTQGEEMARRFAAANRRFDEVELQTREGTCPSCGQRIGPEHRERCLTPLKREIAALDAEIAARDRRESELVEAATDAKLKANADERSAAAGRELVRVRTALQGLERERANLRAVATRHVESVLAAKRAELQREVERIAAAVNPHRREEDIAIARVREAENKLAEHYAERDRMALQAALHEYWRHGFSKQGIQSLLMDEVAGAFNAARGAIFPALTQGVYDVQFSTLSRTKAGEQRERTEFKVYEHGLLVPYESLSGGQRRRIDVGVMLTLVKAVSVWMHAPGALGLLVLDEVFGFLDASGAEGLMEALREVQAVVPAIYAISHDPQLQALFSGMVMIEQDALGVSRIVGGGVDSSEMAVAEANQ